jgi:tripartite-type tricarboxylate transporter receptor subunit TctC
MHDRYTAFSARRALRSLLMFSMAAAATAATATAATAYPVRPVTLVVTYPPGGTVDLVARLIGPRLSAELGQPVVIENKGGAGGMIGGAYVAKAPADGYTLMMDASNHGQNPALHSKMNFDTLRDFAPVSLLLRVPNILVVTPSYPVKTVADLVQAAQRTDGPHVYYASSGPGSAQHLAGELFNFLAHTHMQHVPYKGGGPAMVDVMSGQVPVMFASMGSSWAHVRSGKLRAVASGGTQRSASAPDLPTIAESGVPGYSSYEWNAVFAPAGTPPAIINRLSQALAQVLKDPQVARQLTDMGAELVGSTPAELDTFRRGEIDKWKKVVDEAHLQLD